MNVTYKILFTVELLNDYYKDSCCDDFAIVPSAETLGLIKRYQLLYRLIGNKLVVLIKAGVGDTPLTPLNPDAKFVFYLELNKPAFVNFTNVDLNALVKNRFYFSNINQNKEGSFLNLTKKISLYNNLVTYTPGALVDDGTNTVFECINNTTGNDTTTAFWASRGSSQFATVSDMVQPASVTLNHTASIAATEHKVIIFSLNKTTGNYTDIAKTETKNFDEATRNVQIDLSSIEKGKYLVKVNSEEFFVYADSEFLNGGYFGVVEIQSHLSNSSDFSFFNIIPAYSNTTSYHPEDVVDDGAGNIFECLVNTTGNNTSNVNFWKPRGRLQGIIKEIVYTICFANRRAFWKYISAFRKVANIKVKGSHDPVITPFASFSSDPATDPARKDFFLSEKPLLMSENPGENNFELMLNPPHDSSSPAAAKADGSLNGMLTKEDDNFYCNIYINY